MRNAFNKELARSISRSLGRFLAIAAIVALGTGFYAGLRMTAPDMKIAADEFFDGTGLMDVRVLSTLGLTDDDIAALRDVEGVQAVMPAYETDVMVTMAGEQYATRVHSLPDAARASDTSDGVHARTDDPDYLNRPILVEGAWPEREGECVLSADLVEAEGARIGDTVRIDEWSEGAEDALVTTEYTVVGFVSSPYYATSSSLGTTSLGSGSITQYMYVPEDDFSKDLPFTEAFVAVAGAAGERSDSAAYAELVAEVTERIEALAPAREQARADDLRADAQRELDVRVDDAHRLAEARLQMGLPHDVERVLAQLVGFEHGGEQPFGRAVVAVRRIDEGLFARDVLREVAGRGREARRGPRGRRPGRVRGRGRAVLAGMRWGGADRARMRKGAPDRLRARSGDGLFARAAACPGPPCFAFLQPCACACRRMAAHAGTFSGASSARCHPNVPSASGASAPSSARARGWEAVPFVSTVRADAFPSGPLRALGSACPASAVRGRPAPTRAFSGVSTLSNKLSCPGQALSDRRPRLPPSMGAASCARSASGVKSTPAPAYVPAHVMKKRARL